MCQHKQKLIFPEENDELSKKRFDIEVNYWNRVWKLTLPLRFPPERVFLSFLSKIINADYLAKGFGKLIHNDNRLDKTIFLLALKFLIEYHKMKVEVSNQNKRQLTFS